MRNPFKVPRDTFPSSFEFTFDYNENSSGYLKKMALETVISFVARSVATSTFRHVVDGKRDYGEIDYRLNVRPNLDSSAFSFWYQFVFKLIYNNEVLVIFDDTGDMLIADTFDRTEYAVFPDYFSNVTVKDYTFQRTFQMDEVIYLKFSNEKLSRYMDGMLSDYTELFNRLIAVKMRSNQLRAVVGIDAVQSLDAEKQSKLQALIDRTLKTVTEKAVAFIPKMKGFEYEEVSSGEGSSAVSVEDLTKLKSSLIDEVADALGVPQALLHGDIADMDSLIKSYVKFCINPINKMIEDELNAKIIGKEDYMNGERIKIVGIKANEATENADAIEKLISSGAFTPNQVLELFGEEPSDDSALDIHYITRNFTTANSMTLEGGETN